MIETIQNEGVMDTALRNAFGAMGLTTKMDIIESGEIFETFEEEELIYE